MVQEVVIRGKQISDNMEQVISVHEGQLSAGKILDGTVLYDDYVVVKPNVGITYASIIEYISNPGFNPEKVVVSVYPTQQQTCNLELSNEIQNDIFTGYASYTSMAATGSRFVLTSTTAYSGVVNYLSGSYSDISNSMGNRTVNDSPFPFTAVNDAMLIRYTSPLNGVILVNGTKGVYDGTFVYEYWNGSTWNSLSDIYMISTSMTDWSDMTVTDGSTPFKGICDIIRWHSPDDWVSSSPGGSLVAGFWMRIRLATKNSITTTPILSYSQIATTSTATSFESTFLAPFNGSDKMRMKIYLTGGNIDAIPMPIFIRIMAY